MDRTNRKKSLHAGPRCRGAAVPQGRCPVPGRAVAALCDKVGILTVADAGPAAPSTTGCVGVKGGHSSVVFASLRAR